MRAGDRVCITAQLVHAATDQHLWARRYERDLRDLLHLQSDLARAIADEIQVELTPQERARLGRIRPVDMESHDAYLRGCYHLGRVHPERSIEHLQRAIAIDPDNALAYAGIAYAQCMMFAPGVQLVPPAEIAPAVRAAAHKALELDESLAEPHVALAAVLFWHDRDPVGAEWELRRAIQVNPNCALAHYICGLQFADLRRSDEAIAEFQRTLQLEPVSCWFATIAGFFMYELGHEAAGREQMQKAFDLDTDFCHFWSLQSVIDCDEGNFPEAVAKAREGVRLSAGLPMARGYAAYALGMGGRRTEARAILDELEKVACQRYVPASARAWGYLGLGDHERAIEWLETGYAERDSYLPNLRLVRAFRPLDPDPRFQDLLGRLGLPS